MRITLGTTFRDGTTYINRAAEQLADAQRQVSTGRRINVASDDPSGNSVAMSQNSTIAQIDAYTKASDAASSRLSIADSALSDIIDKITAAQSAALSARGSKVPQSQRDAAVQTLASIRDSIASDMNTQVLGTYLFAGTDSTTAPYTQAADGTVSAYLGNGSTASADISTTRTVPLTFDGSQIMKGTDPKDIFGVIADLTTAIQAGDNDAIGLGLVSLNSAFARATTAQTSVGTALNALDDGRDQLSVTRTQALTRLSQVQDADMAGAISAMTKADTAYRAAIAAFANAGRTSLMDYLQ